MHHQIMRLGVGVAVAVSSSLGCEVTSSSDACDADAMDVRDSSVVEVDSTAIDADATVVGERDAQIVDCSPATEPLAAPGDCIEGDSWQTFAKDFFMSWCTGCHGPTSPPYGLNWENPAIVRDNLAAIRSAVGVGMYMPPDDPQPPCDERRRLVRWIDANAP